MVRISDLNTYIKAFKFLTDSGRTPERDEIFPNPLSDKPIPNNWVKYDQVVKGLFLNEVKTHPMEVLKAFTFYKFAALLRNLRFAISPRKEDFQYFNFEVTSQALRSEYDLYYQPLRFHVRPAGQKAVGRGERQSAARRAATGS